MRMAALLLALATLVFGTTSLAPTTGRAQTNPCQTNPDPVDPANPTVIVTSPAANATVTSPITVTGQAAVFEAVVSLALYDSSGNQISTTTTMTAEGQTLSAFSGPITFSVTAATPACLWVFEASAQDGSPTNVVQVPLTLQPASTALPATGTGGGEDGQFFVLWALAALAAAGGGLVATGWAAGRTRA